MKVYDYTPDNNNRWCREGVAIEERPGVLFDTFWNGGSDRHRLTTTEIATATLRFDTDDYDEPQRWSGTSWDERAPKDRETITSHHGLSVRYFVRKGSKPSKKQVIKNAQKALDEAERSLSSAQSRVRWAQENLDRARS